MAKGREMSRRDRAKAAVENLQDSAAFAAMVEDVYVVKRCPGQNSVRAVAAPDGEIWFVSTSEDALREMAGLVERGAPVRAKKLKMPSHDELEGWIEGTIPQLPERSEG